MKKYFDHLYRREKRKMPNKLNRWNLFIYKEQNFFRNQNSKTLYKSVIWYATNIIYTCVHTAISINAVGKKGDKMDERNHGSSNKIKTMLTSLKVHQWQMVIVCTWITAKYVQKELDSFQSIPFGRSLSYFSRDGFLK